MTPIYCGMFVLIRLSAVDGSSRPSKVRGTVLPQEYTLAQFVSNLTDKELTWSEETPACEWKYVECNPDKQVVSLEWSNTFLDSAFSDYPSVQGQVLWEFIPNTLRVFRACRQGLTGPVKLSLLPPQLRIFVINLNLCDGTLDLTLLPCDLKNLTLNSNKFVGEIDLTRLPASLQNLDLHNNRLHGKLDLAKLPEALIVLRLSDNYFDIPESIPDLVVVGSQSKYY